MARKSSSARRQDFVQATIEVITQHGIANATTRTIAEASDSPLASLHYLFKSKSDLFYAVFEDMLRDMVVKVQQDAVSGVACDAVQVLFRQIVDWSVRTPKVARAQWEVYSWMLRQEPKVAMKAYGLTKESYRNLFVPVFPNSTDEELLEQVTRATMYFADGILLCWWTYQDEAVLQSDIKLACNILRDLIAHGQANETA